MAFDTDFAAFAALALPDGAVYANIPHAARVLGFGPQKTACMHAALANRWKIKAGEMTPAAWKRHARSAGYGPRA